MALDRDVGVAVARAAFDGSDSRGWEMLAATGVRGLRVAVESGRFRSFLLTEAHPVAAAFLRENARDVAGARARCADARSAEEAAGFEYVDLDPYGSPLPYLPAAARSVADGGVLAVTATDLMVLAGAQPSACERRYDARPVRGRLGPEGGLRILIRALAIAVGVSGRGIRPLLSYVGDHHLRSYVRVDSAVPVALEPIGTIRPEAWSGPDLGPGGPFGPMWLGPLSDGEFLGRLTTPPTSARPHELSAFLERAREDAEVGAPFYYEANRLAHALGLAAPAPLLAWRQRLRELGHRFARAQGRPEGFRTDAPRASVEAIARDLSTVSPRTPGSARSSARPAGSR